MYRNGFYVEDKEVSTMTVVEHKTLNEDILVDGISRAEYYKQRSV